MMGFEGKGTVMNNLDHRITSRVTENISQTLHSWTAFQIIAALQHV